jgi:NDP-sugar pyrophosphorylase family protein
MPSSHLSRKTVSLDCDTIYFADILDRVRKMPKGYGACFYFEDTGNQPIFSYIRTKTDQSKIEVIHEIKEKMAISNKANSGAYVFPSASILSTAAANLLDHQLTATTDTAGEYFTSQIIDQMIEKGESPFMGIPIKHVDFCCVGTPKQLREFLRIIRDEEGHVKPKKQRFCFDLDLTLVGVPATPGDYSTCPPIWKNIELVRALHKSGHHIIIVSIS